MRSPRFRRARSGFPGTGLGVAVPAVAVLALGVAGCAPPDSASDPAASDPSPASLAPDQVDAIHAIATAPIEAGRTAGMSIAVVRGTDTLLIEEFGHAALELGV
ncbi:MAG: hypothetical protein F4X22_02210, partial [Gemmatimonadales bacterium]|nr:hypothetical protein [Candidatus Palauibacter denitrificans]